MMLTGSEILLKVFKEHEVDTIFGFPGGAVLYIYDTLFKQLDHFNHVLTSHEQGAAHAADAYARSTGKTGVCIATSGPGATNLVTGIATAYMDSVPMVAITGNVPVGLLGKDSFQEIDVAGVTTPITKHNYIVKDVTKLADVIREAFYIANEGRKGPVLIDIPKDITNQKTEYTYKEPREIIPESKDIKDTDIDEAIKMIKKAKRPFIFIGGGVIFAEAEKEVAKFVELCHAPVTCSLMGMGGFPGQDEMYTGMLGMHGTKASNIGVQKCDLLVAIGVRFSDRVTGNTKKFARKANIIHIDIDPAEINKNVEVDHFIIGDAKEVLTRINEKLEKQDNTPWVDDIKELIKHYPVTYPEGLTGQYAIEKLYEVTNGEAIITTEVGQHQMWAAQHYPFKDPRYFLTSGGLGTMGYGTGAALGAQVGNPDKLVVNIAGDGSFRMNLNEMITAVNYKLPIKVLLLNNHVLGMVRQWQTIFYDERYSFTTLRDINYEYLAKAFGCSCVTIKTKEEVVPMLKKAIEMEGPVIINVLIHEDEKVLPMVAPGAPIDDLITK